MLNGINIIIPTYKRPGLVRGYHYFKNAVLFLPESQFEDYAKHYDTDRIVTCPDSQDGNIARKRNAALDAFQKPLLFLDDDVECLMVNQGGHMRRLRPEEAEAVIIAGFNLCHEWGCPLWGLNVNDDPKSGQPYKPFSLTSPICGPFQGHLEHDLKFDERMASKDDFDFCLQALNKHKKILRFNFLAYKCAHGGNAGGIVSHRTMAYEMELCRRLEAKWGRSIVRFPLRPKRIQDLLNPERFSPPISGV